MGNIIKESVISLGTGDPMELNKKQQEYHDYIVEHIANVQWAYNYHFIPLLDKVNISSLIPDEELHEAIRSIQEDVETHDASKFGDDEFDAYRAKYYQTAEEAQADEETQKLLTDKAEEAWIHHYTVNNHHPKFWVDPITKEIKDMTLGAIIHMVCDWVAMGKKFGNDTRTWYENEADEEKKAMTDNTKKLLEEILYNIIDV
jgi:FAD/FMN-containing dehydrogenase